MSGIATYTTSRVGRIDFINLLKMSYHHGWIEEQKRVKRLPHAARCEQCEGYGKYAHETQSGNRGCDGCGHTGMVPIPDCELIK